MVRKSRLQDAHKQGRDRFSSTLWDQDVSDDWDSLSNCNDWVEWGNLDNWDIWDDWDVCDTKTKTLPFLVYHDCIVWSSYFFLRPITWSLRKIENWVQPSECNQNNATKWMYLIACNLLNSTKGTQPSDSVNATKWLQPLEYNEVNATKRFGESTKVHATKWIQASDCNQVNATKWMKPS